MVKIRWQPDKASYVFVDVIWHGLPAYNLDVTIAPTTGPRLTDGADDQTEMAKGKKTKAKKTTKKTKTSKLYY